MISLSLLVMGLTGAMADPADPTAWDTLHRSLTSSSATHRRQALNALGAIGPSNSEAVRLIEDSLLNDKDTLVRQTAAAVLGEMKARQSVSALEKALDDKTPVAFTAAKALADMGEDTPALALFVEVITGERKDAPSVTESALKYAKKKLTHPGQLALMGINETSGALLGPGAIGVIAGEEALKVEDPFKDKGATGRAMAASYLAKESDPYALTLLEWALSDSNWGVRAAAAKALGERGNSGSIAKLQPLLKDGHTGVRTMAAAAIIRLQEGNQPAPSESADRARP